MQYQKITLKRSFMYIFSIIMTSFYVSLSLKAAIGVSAWNALYNTISLITRMKIGTCSLLMNIVCILVQLVILKKNFGIRNILQIPVAFLIGWLTNFFYYIVLKNFSISLYPLRLAVYLLAIALGAFASFSIVESNVVCFPLEGAVKTLSDKFGIRFSILKQIFDISFLVIVLLLCLTTKVELSIREGTIIAMLIYGPEIGIFEKTCGPFYRRHGFSETPDTSSPEHGTDSQ